MIKVVSVLLVECFVVCCGIRIVCVVFSVIFMCRNWLGRISFLGLLNCRWIGMVLVVGDMVMLGLIMWLLF